VSRVVSRPSGKEFFAAAMMARCTYCGGAACSGGMDSPGFSPGGQQQMKFLCLPCLNEFGRHWQQQLEHVPQNLPQQEQMAAIRTLLDETEHHMKQWVSERGSR
jgi:hypothetical protein